MNGKQILNLFGVENHIDVLYFVCTLAVSIFVTLMLISAIGVGTGYFVFLA